tara:strand:+ start:34 stop:618 length:585 start_codon:yes stop_codon:yes gene_type:complete
MSPKIHNPIDLSNDFGHIKFGHITPRFEYAGVLVRNGAPGPSAEHYMMFMSSGTMAGGTINRCPGVYQIHCGEDPVDDTAMVINAARGDIILKAPKGRIRLDARNVDIKATGPNNKSGHINIESNEKITIKSKNIEVNGDAVAKFLSSGTCELVGNSALNFYGGMIDCADSATTVKASKGVSPFEDQQRGGGFL